MPLLFHHKHSKFPTLGHSKTRWGSLHKKHEYFLGVSSFLSLPLSLNIVGLSSLGDLSRSPSLSLSSWFFLPYNFQESILNSTKHSTVAIAEQGYAPHVFQVPCRPNDLGHRGSKTGRPAPPCLGSPRGALGTPSQTLRCDPPCVGGCWIWEYTTIRGGWIVVSDFHNFSGKQS